MRLFLMKERSFEPSRRSRISRTKVLPGYSYPVRSDLKGFLMIFLQVQPSIRPVEVYHSEQGEASREGKL